MQLTHVDTILIIGVILSLLFTEITGVLPAGLIVPGYLTLLIKQPQAIFLTFFISILTYLIVCFGVNKFTILYGKRKFTAMITIAIVLQFFVHTISPFDYGAVYGLSAVGIVVPGLLANTIQRQGLVTTFLSTGLLIAVTYGCTMLLHINS